jgi:F-type H+-transporting ATPase subunit delta
MIAGSLARRYARAIFEIGVDSAKYEPLGNEIADVAGAMTTSKELADVMENPVFPRSQRRKVLDKVLMRLGVSKTTRNFCYLLLDRERISALPAIARELTVMIDDKARRIKATVTSAKPLTPAQEQQLKQTLEKISGKNVQVSKSEDSDLLGGVIAQLGDVEYDGSLRTQLNRMRDSLVK